MGGNLVMKLAGELGEDAPGYLKAVVGVSPAMDLAVSADALHSISNRVYEWKFLIGLRAALSAQGRALSRHLFHRGLGEDYDPAPV